jgi:peptidoglycan pentaglycine glycine transferase (the first glycine)
MIEQCNSGVTINKFGEYSLEMRRSLNDPDWDKFLASLPGGKHVQTSMWSQVKSELGYSAMRIIAYKNGAIIGGGQILVRKFTPFFSLAYMPKGPVFFKWDPKLAEILVEELKGTTRANHFLLLAVQPGDYELELKELFTYHSFQPSWMELAPTATLLLDLAPDTEQILAQMKRQTRQNILRSQRMGMTIREGTEVDLHSYYQLHLITSKRQAFVPYPESYFFKMWQVFSKTGLISLIIAEYKNLPVSALLLISFGDTVFAKTLGWSGQYAEHRPNDAVFWGSIKWAKLHGYRYFDFEGINRKGAEIMLSGQSLPEELHHSPDFLKLGYGGKVTLMPQSNFYVSNTFLRWVSNNIFGQDEGDPRLIKHFRLIRRFFT